MVCAVPKTSPDAELVWWSKIVTSHGEMQAVRNRSIQDTGEEPVILEEVNLTQDVAEKDVSPLDIILMLMAVQIVPRLCEYFAEICEIVPATRKGEGWLVTISHPNEAILLMNVSLRRRTYALVLICPVGDWQDSRHHLAMGKGGRWLLQNRCPSCCE